LFSPRCLLFDQQLFPASLRVLFALVAHMSCPTGDETSSTQIKLTVKKTFLEVCLDGDRLESHRRNSAPCLHAGAPKHDAEKHATDATLALMLSNMHSAKGMGAPMPPGCSSMDDEDDDDLALVDELDRQITLRSLCGVDELDRQITAGSSFCGVFDPELNVWAPPPCLPPPYFVDCGTTQNYTDIAEFPGTLMVRNLTPDLTQPEFVQHLMNGGYRGLFDFIYMPMNRGRGNRGLFDNLQGRGNFGYAFVNFGSHTIAAQVMARLQDSEKGDPLCSLEWTAVWSTCQGFEANIDRYRNSPLMHHVVPNDAKPSVYDSWGNLATFPTPTKTIPKPRIHQPHPKEDMATNKNV